MRPGPRGPGSVGVRRYLAGLAASASRESASGSVPCPPTVAWGDNWAWLATQIAMVAYTVQVEGRLTAWHRDRSRALVKTSWPA